MEKVCGRNKLIAWCFCLNCKEFIPKCLFELSTNQPLCSHCGTHADPFLTPSSLQLDYDELKIRHFPRKSTKQIVGFNQFQSCAMFSLLVSFLRNRVSHHHYTIAWKSCNQNKAYNMCNSLGTVYSRFNGLMRYLKHAYKYFFHVGYWCCMNGNLHKLDNIIKVVKSAFTIGC